MNVQDFTFLLQNPDKVVTPIQTRQLEEVLEEYPYFQAARALHLKGLKNLNSFKYNNALKVTAAYTTDRDILFDFITSDDFSQNSIADTISGKVPITEAPETAAGETTSETEEPKALIPESEDKPLPQDLKDADKILDPKLFKSKDPEIDRTLKEEKQKAEKDLEIGQPIPFTKKEKHSFSEWLQLATVKTIEREPETKEKEGPDTTKDGDFPLEKEVLKKKKFELIDKFIENNPKISPTPKTSIKIDIKDSVKIDKTELMTETLAKVYLEQKKYKKAIQAYKILSLKYPEKSGFFADRIKAAEKIQQENT
ncbi:hypothetical protein [Maribacter polysaccharolyticus]|uniref:hypothetical protein n=1 Tax=Maribacter polysaccharolyticus TaxID=3020831 RepID=UPI00237FB852|nr:hypothetical protein [Maribacter polysaccharolyticus]MDE3742856.1 hypothetical protein [Maribacter polysaccharolyticus]